LNLKTGAPVSVPASSNTSTTNPKLRYRNAPRLPFWGYPKLEKPFQFHFSGHLDLATLFACRTIHLMNRDPIEIVRTNTFNNFFIRTISNEHHCLAVAILCDNPSLNPFQM
jgi:hypothetical protein